MRPRAAADGSALGVDLSSQMLDFARRRARTEGVTNASFLQADAQIHPFEPAAFDVAISRTGAMFFGDQPAAFANIGRSLVPGGRMILVTWQGLAANEWVREITTALAAGRDQPAPPPDAPGPFSLSDIDRIVAVLSSAGFTDVDVDGVSADMWFGTDVDDAHRFVIGLLGWMLRGLDDTARSRALDDLRNTMVSHATPDGVVFGSAAWVVRAMRR